MSIQPESPADPGVLDIEFGDTIQYNQPMNAERSGGQDAPRRDAFDMTIAEAIHASQQPPLDLTRSDPRKIIPASPDEREARLAEAVRLRVTRNMPYGQIAHLLKLSTDHVRTTIKAYIAQQEAAQAEAAALETAQQQAIPTERQEVSVSEREIDDPAVRYFPEPSEETVSDAVLDRYNINHPPSSLHPQMHPHEIDE